MANVCEPNIDRLMAAIRGEKPDRIPNFEDIVDPRNTAAIMGLPPSSTVSSRGLPPADYVEFARRTNQDVINVVMDSKLTENGAIRTWDDIRKIETEMPDPSLYRQRMLSYIEAAKGTGVGICANICAPFFRAYMMTGPIPIQDFLLKLCDDPDFAERVMELHTQHQMQIVEAILDLPIDFFIVADDTCGANGFFCSPELMDAMWAPLAKRIVSLIKQKNLPIMWHCCGKLDQVLPYLIEWEVDCVEPVQPSCNNIYELKERWNGQLSFKGNISIDDVLPFGTSAEVAADTREHIERLGNDGGYILASSHSIIDTIPPENYRSMIDTVIEHGNYL